MGVSSDGVLFYGIMLNEEDEEGIPEWMVGPMGTDEEEEEDNEVDTYELSKILQEKFGVHLDFHCSYDYPMYFLSFGEPLSASRGFPTPINSFTVGDDWDQKLNEAADFIGCPKDKRDIKWWLASLYG